MKTHNKEILKRTLFYLTAAAIGLLSVYGCSGKQKEKENTAEPTDQVVVSEAPVSESPQVLQSSYIPLPVATDGVDGKHELLPTREVHATPDPVPTQDAQNVQNTQIMQDTGENMLKIEIIIADKRFEAELFDSPSARAFAEMLPMKPEMKELNGNEKYFYLENSLPTAEIRPSEITEGELMLYGNNCLVLFYKSFQTSYSYTPLGRVLDPQGLAEALGTGSAEISFSIKE